MRRIRSFSVAIVLAAIVAGDARAESGTSWLVVTTRASPPAGVYDALRQVGGTIVRDYPEVGTIVVAAADPRFPAAAEAIPGVSSVVPNVSIQVDLDGEEAADAQPLAPPADEPLYSLQWGLHAIRAKG